MLGLRGCGLASQSKVSDGRSSHPASQGLSLEVVLDVSEGEEAGIKGAVLEIRGQYAFGFLRP